MNNSIEIKDKIKVFISSKCGIEKYDKVRKELKTLLEDTGCINVYLFEDSMATSRNAVESYISKLEDSHVCLFLISNDTEVPEGVVKEYKTALRSKIKSIFIFCNDDNKEITWVQQEILNSNGPKYITINEFDELKQTGYQSLITEIIDIYTDYCKGKLVLRNNYDINKNGIDNFNDDDLELSDEIDKSLYSNINFTKNKLCEYIGLKSDIPEDQINQFDVESSKFLDIIFYSKSLSGFDNTKLLDEVRRKQNKKYYEVIEYRWGAIINYYNGDIYESIENMNKAYDIAKINNLPNWYLQDISIDIRNLVNLRNEMRNKYFVSNKEQERITLDNKPLYYPIIDRNEKNLYKEIIKETISEASKSPSTVRYGNNIYRYMDYISNNYITALYYGSLTQLILILDMVKLMAYQLCDEYDDWNFRKLLLKTTLLSNKPKDIKDVYNLFNDIYGKMDHEDAKEIYKSIQNYPIAHSRKIREFLCFQYLGCYFDDDFFIQVWNELCAYILTWIYDNNNRVTNLGYYILDAIEFNINRISNEQILNIIILLIDNDFSLFYRNAVSLLADLKFNDVSTEAVIKLLDKAIKLVNLDGRYFEYENLAVFLSKINKCFDDNININTKIELIVNEYLPGYARSLYDVLEIDDALVILNYINKNIQEIHERNKTQGIGGKYTMSGYNSYLNIRNIIDIKEIEINENINNEIIEACVETLLAENQLINEKCEAVDLIISILINNDNFKDNQEIKFLLENEEAVLNVRDLNVIGKQSQFTLNFKFNILKLVLDRLETDDLILLLATYTNVDDFDKIEALRTVLYLCKYGYILKAKDDVKASILQFILQKSYDSNLNVRYHSVNAMLYMLESYNKKSIINRINKVMNFDSAHIKFLILKNLDNIKSLDNEAYNYIKSKAESDSHFIIRNYKNYL